MPTPPGWENADTCARLRAQVFELAGSRWAEAYERAVEIPIPWYRVQALCGLVPHAPESRVDELLRRAQAEAAKGHDEYQRIAVLTWVIEAALSRGRGMLARQVLTSALAHAPGITPLKSLAAALDLLLGVAVQIAEPEAKATADALLRVAETYCNSSSAGGRRYGKYYINVVAFRLHANFAPLGLRLIAARFGQDRAVTAFARLNSLPGF